MKSDSGVDMRMSVLHICKVHLKRMTNKKYGGNQKAAKSSDVIAIGIVIINHHHHHHYQYHYFAHFSFAFLLNAMRHATVLSENFSRCKGVRFLFALPFHHICYFLCLPFPEPAHELFTFERHP